jgi:hypothetical protein
VREEDAAIAEVAVILHFDGDARELLPKWQRAVELWRERYEGYRGPASSLAGESERGGLTLVNVFENEQDHLDFGQKMGTPLAEAGLPTPGLEHVTILTGE